MKVVAVFSGGGAKAIAHAGAWRAISEAGHHVTHIVATSFGAVIGAMFAAGANYDDLIRGTTGLKTSDVAPIDLMGLVKGMFASAILKPEPLRTTIARLVPAQRFADLRIPLTVTTTDLDSGEQIVFGGAGSGERDAPLQDVLYATCALPLYYPPAEIDGRRLGDGGIRDVLPLGPASRLPCDAVIAVDVGPGFDEVRPPDRRTAVPPVIRIHGETVRIMMAAETERAIAAWPKTAPRLIVVRAVAEREATFAVDQVERYLEAGYQKTRTAL